MWNRDSRRKFWKEKKEVRDNKKMKWLMRKVPLHVTFFFFFANLIKIFILHFFGFLQIWLVILDKSTFNSSIRNVLKTVLKELVEWFDHSLVQNPFEWEEHTIPWLKCYFKLVRPPHIKIVKPYILFEHN